MSGVACQHVQLAKEAQVTTSEVTRMSRGCYELTPGVLGNRKRKPATMVGRNLQLRWIVNSVRVLTLVGSSAAADADCSVKKMAPHRLAIANGRIAISEEASARIEDIGLNIGVLLLKDSPTMRPLGRHCMQKESAFRWGAGKLPQMCLTNDRASALEVQYVVRDRVARPHSKEQWGEQGNPCEWGFTRTSGGEALASSGFPG